MFETFDANTQEQNTQILANYLPNGDLLIGKNTQGTNLRKLLFGMAREMKRSEELIALFAVEHDINQTNLLIENWESALGIPDDCIEVADTIEERRRNVLLKLFSLGAQTAQDFIDIAALFGFTVTIIPLTDVAFPPYDVPFIPVGFPSGRFVWIVEGENIVLGVPPYDVPFDLIVGPTIIQCLFNQLKPANTRIIFRNTN